MTAGFIHFDFGFLIGAEEPERYKEDVQKTGVVRILDVFKHQFPVAGDLLAHGSQNAQRPPIEDTLEVVPHQLAQILTERNHLVVERYENHSIDRLHFQLVQAVVGQREVGRHTAHAAIAICNALAERNAEQIPFEIIIPLMVNAGKMGSVAVRAAADARATMSALVYDRVQFALFVSGDNNRRIPNGRGLEIARLRQFGFKTYVIPG